ncbi:MAG: NADH-quinone oxidoreductase subunit NuoE [Robiginitomaculum sp.]|nr:MAG: NADH-quinone oxidoreductase subunit NuoE [Robiginitomaculum sp.]
MSTRRLAKEQPKDFKLSKPALKEIEVWAKKYPKDRRRSALIPAMWIAQKDAGGWLPEPALRALGDLLGMAYIRVYEVATFYTMFNLEPVGEHHIQLCGTTPCWLRGAGELKKVCEKKIGPKGSVSADGKLSWIEVECLGACANAPMVQISNAAGDDYYEDLTEENFGTLLDDLSAGRKVQPGPQNERHTSEPEGGADTLNAKGLYNKVKAKKLPNAVAKKAASKKAASKKASKKSVAKKVTAKKTVAKKPGTKKSAAKKPTAKKTATKKKVKS